MSLDIEQFTETGTYGRRIRASARAESSDTGATVRVERDGDGVTLRIESMYFNGPDLRELAQLCAELGHLLDRQ